MLNAKAMALTWGIAWGLAMLVGTLLAVYANYLPDFWQFFTRVYPGYEVTALGSLVGGVYGFVDAAVGAWVMTVIYNWFAKKF